MSDKTIADQLAPELERLRQSLMGLNNAVEIYDENDMASFDDWEGVLSSVNHLMDDLERLHKRVRREVSEREEVLADVV